MKTLPLDPNDVTVETFDTGAPDASLTLGGPVGGPKTWEPGCTAFPELCPTQTTTVAYVA